MGRIARSTKPPSSGAVLFYVPPHKAPPLPSKSTDEKAGDRSHKWAASVSSTSSTPGTSTSQASTLVGSRTSDVSSKDLLTSSASELAEKVGIAPSGVLLSNSGALLGLAKDVAEAFNGVPYVKAVASVVQLLLEITETVQSNEQRAKELLDKVQIYARDIFEALLMFNNDGDKVTERLKQDLLDVTKVLENIYDSIKQLCALNTLTRVLQRTEILSHIEEQDRRLDTCITSFQIRSLSVIRAKQLEPVNVNRVEPAPTYQLPRFKNKLRSKPQIMFGRDKEIEEIITLIIDNKSSRVAILGSGGIGKTSLALSAVHDERVSKKFANSRVFLSCEAITSADHLINDLAYALDIPTDGTVSNLITAILQCLETTPTLIVFDNFETPWDRTDSRAGVELFLQDISSVETCTIIVTLRGSQRPSGIEWTKHLPPLTPVDLESATATFKAISHKMDDFAVKLMKAVDCVPLAVTLLANLAAVDGETTEALWERWNKENTSMVENGSDRLTSLETSVELSLLSPRMRRDPDALGFLSILALLPDGMSQETLHACGTQLPTVLNVKRAISTLRQNALIYEDSNSFIRILSPIRLFVIAHHPPDSSAKLFLQNYFADLASQSENFGDSDVRKRLRAESGNIEALLVDCLRSRKSVDDVAGAVLHFCQFMYCSGINSTQIIEQLAQRLESEKAFADDQKIDKATKRSKVFHFSFLRQRKKDTSQQIVEHAPRKINLPIKLRGDCFGSWGQMLSRQSKFDLAQDKFDSAIVFHKQAGDLDGEAYDLHNLGYLLVRDLSTLDEADAQFQRAYKLHKRAGNTTGQAHDLMGRGHISLQRTKLLDAQKHFEEALNTFIKTSDEAGQAIALNNLASTLNSSSKFNGAEELYQRSLDLNLRTGDTVGISESYAGLGCTFLLRSQFANARKYIQAAVDVRSPSVDADHLHLLGRVNIAEYQFVEAEETLKRAQMLHEELMDKSGVADGNHYLAHMYYFQGKTELALTQVVAAKGLYQEVGNKLGEADATAFQGIITARSEMDPENGMYFLDQALGLHRTVGCILGQAFDFHHTGRLHLRKESPDIETAIEMFEKSLQMHEAVGNVQGEADDHNMIAECLMRYQQFPDAILRVSRALSLHTRIGDIGGQADDIYIQGSIFLHQRRYEEAETAIRLAMEMHEKVGLKFAEICDFATLCSVLFEKELAAIHVNGISDGEMSLSRLQSAVSMLKEANDRFKIQISAPLEARQCALLRGQMLDYIE
ncbi:hypothetical protein BDQ17DRAFT_1230703 [Cyathus striatus]|nr:hypothetical protein BDQ17DRAFT_1230703 [Cyathus striatus]